MKHGVGKCIGSDVRVTTAGSCVYNLVQIHQFGAPQQLFLSFRVVFGTKHAFTHRSLTPRHCVLAISRLTFRIQQKILHRFKKRSVEKSQKFWSKKIAEVGKFSKNRKIENFENRKIFEGFQLKFFEIWNFGIFGFSIFEKFQLKSFVNFSIFKIFDFSILAARKLTSRES